MHSALVHAMGMPGAMQCNLVNAVVINKPSAFQRADRSVADHTCVLDSQSHPSAMGWEQLVLRAPQRRLLSLALAEAQLVVWLVLVLQVMLALLAALKALLGLLDLANLDTPESGQTNCDVRHQTRYHCHCRCCHLFLQCCNKQWHVFQVCGGGGFGGLTRALASGGKCGLPA